MRLYLLPLLVVLSTPRSAPTVLCPTGCTCGTVDIRSASVPSAEAWCYLGNTILTVEQKRNWWEVKCDSGDVTCDSLPQFSYGNNASIDLKLTYCSLSSLECLPQRLQASSVRQLQLYATAGTDVSKRMIKGMNLETFFFYGDVDSIPASFPREALSQFPKLEMLTINQANLTIREGDLDVFSKLRMLEFTLTHIGKLPAGLFRNLESLETLLLWGNDFEELPEHILDGLGKLRVLSLENNRLRSLKFLAVAPSLPALPALTDVTVYRNRLESLPRLSHLTNLTKLVVNSQEGEQPLVISPGALSQLPLLESLSLEGSRIAELPADVFRGSRAIRDINLANNLIETLPKGLFLDQESLRSLRLDGNLVRALPPGCLRGLSALDTLSVAGNRLEELPGGALGSLGALRSLDASRNRLRSIPPGALPAGVTRLLLDRNRLNFAGDEGDYENVVSVFPFNNLLNLETLSLSHNRLTRMFPDAGLMTKLHVLDLSYNNISEISESHVNFVSGNLTVDLRHNNISFVVLGDAPLPPGAQADGANSRLLLDHNPLDCDCRLYHLALRLQGRRSPASEPVFDVGDARCAFPERLKGAPVATLALDDFACPIPEKFKCSHDCRCEFRPHRQALELDCAEEPRVWPEHDEVALALRLRTAPATLSLRVPGLRLLNLTRLAIEEIPAGRLPDSVAVLDLSENRLSGIPAQLLERNVTLRLAGNRFACDCWHRNDVSLLQREHRRVDDWERVLCADGVPLRKLNPGQLCSAWFAAGVGGTLALLGLLVAVVASVLYIYSLEVRVWLYSRGFWFMYEEEMDKNKKYDAFVSFCHKDEQFVVGNLIPGLESGPHPYNICVHYRDWIPGEWIPAQIASSVDASRRTIIVVSKNFLDSLWGRLEFRAANMHAVEERKTRVIVVLLEDISSHKELDPELKAYLSTNTYLKWGDPWFWDKLRYAMPHKGAVRDKKARRAETKARKTGQKLAKQLAGAIDTQLTADGKIINAAKDIVRPKVDELPKMDLAVPKMDFDIPRNKDTPADKVKRPQFDIPRLPTDVVLQLGHDDYVTASSPSDNRPRNLEDVIPRGQKMAS